MVMGTGVSSGGDGGDSEVVEVLGQVRRLMRCPNPTYSPVPHLALT